MVGLEGLEVNEAYACFRPAGPSTVEAIVELLKKVMKASQELGVTRLLVDLTMLSHKPVHRHRPVQLRERAGCVLGSRNQACIRRTAGSS